MKMFVKLAFAISTATLTVPVVAQVTMPQAQQNVLRAGTPITLRFLEGVTTKEKSAKINDRVRLEVAEPIIMNGVTIIPAGSPAIGELTDVRYKGMWGKSGRIVGRALNITANDITVTWRN
jgi:hypothetical protein